jgi:hypothetical protein
MGAMAVLSKPVKTREALEGVFSHIKGVLTRTRQRLLLVTEDDAASREITDVLHEQNLDIDIIRPTTEAMAELPPGPSIASSFDRPSGRCPSPCVLPRSPSSWGRMTCR